jgi:PEP-CTERM motif
VLRACDLPFACDLDRPTLWFGAQGFGAGDTYFRMFINYDTSSNDGSYLIGMGFNARPSEISVIGVNAWQGIEGRMTPASAVPEPSTWVMLLIGFAAIGFAGYRRQSPRIYTAIRSAG